MPKQRSTMTVSDVRRMLREQMTTQPEAEVTDTATLEKAKADADAPVTVVQNNKSATVAPRQVTQQTTRQKVE